MKKFKKVKLKFEKLIASLDYRQKQLKQIRTRSKQLEVLRGVISDYKYLMRIAKAYPDIHIPPLALERELNSVQALYESAKTRRR